MARITKLMVAAGLATWVGGYALAQDVFIYPNQNQSQEQQDKDKYDCYQWAKGQTGFDPSQPRSAGAPPQQTGTLKLPPTSYRRVVIGDTPRHHTARS